VRRAEIRAEEQSEESERRNGAESGNRREGGERVQRKKSKSEERALGINAKCPEQTADRESRPEKYRSEE